MLIGNILSHSIFEWLFLELGAITTSEKQLAASKITELENFSLSHGFKAYTGNI